MNIVKSVVRAVFPIIIAVLKKAAEKTETVIDDYVVAGVEKAIQEWLEDEENDVKFE